VSKLLIFSIFSVTALLVLGFSGDVFAVGGVVSDGPSCLAIGGSWDGVNTCTVPSLTVNSGETLTIESTSGTSEVTFTNDDGTTAAVDITAGNSIAFDAATFSFAAGIENTDNVIITIDGQASTIPPGSSLSTMTTNRDSFITQGGPNSNEGANPTLRIISSDKNRPVVAFDQQQLITVVGEKTLQSAKLRLYIVDNGNNWGSGKPVGSYMLLENWAEGNGWNVGNNIAGTNSGTTWNCPVDINISNNQNNCDTQWEGGNFISTPTNLILITNNMNNQWIEFDVTADVQNFLAGTANYGWLIKKTGDDSLNGSMEFASREATANKPQLVLSFQGQ
jgi:hypothetical protein